MPPVDQLPFVLPHHAAQGGEDFFVTDSNRDAARRIEDWRAWPHHALLLLGEGGAGKSHLAAIWQDRAEALAIDATELANHDTIAASGPVNFLLEDADRTVSGDPARERGLFHLFNRVRERGGRLLLTACQPVAVWGLTLADLKSRLLATPVAQLEPPDDMLLEAVMVKQFADRQLTLPPEVIRFVLPRIERSFAALGAFVEALDQASLAAKRPPTVPLARDVLGQVSERDSEIIADS